LLAAALRFSIFCELALYGFLAYRLAGMGTAAATLAAVAVLLGLRAGIVGTTWLFAVSHASPTRPLGPLRALRMVVAEYLAFLALFLVIQPFERLWSRPDRLRPGRPVLVLIHGYGCNRGAWWWLRRHLEASGFNVATLNLEPLHAGIDDYIPQLVERIEAACREAGRARVTLVGHSMGGLVARAYLAAHGEGRVDRLLTLASPHSGSVLSRLGIGTNARQMETNSPWLKALWRSRPAIPAVAVRTTHDNFVMPQDNQRLPGAVDVELRGLGHLALLFSPRTLDVIRDGMGGNP
jgi:triacylglycerol lipase